MGISAFKQYCCNIQYEIVSLVGMLIHFIWWGTVNTHVNTNEYVDSYR